jgi:hypothetical protein
MLNIISWTDIFIVYHMDCVCIGYEIKSNKFVTLEQRWNNFIVNYPSVYATNLHSQDYLNSLEKSANKYRERGFLVKSLYVYKNMNQYKNRKTIIIESLSGNNNNNTEILEITGTTIIHKFISVYRLCSDAIISDTIDLLYNDKFDDTPDLINYTYLENEHPFMRYVTQFEYPNGYECPIIMEKYNLSVANINCMHDVSLKSFILMNTFKQCPICRKDFRGVIYNILYENRDQIVANEISNYTTKLPHIHKSNIFCEDRYFDKYFPVNNMKKNTNTNMIGIIKKVIKKPIKKSDISNLTTNKIYKSHNELDYDSDSLPLHSEYIKERDMSNQIDMDISDESEYDEEIQRKKSVKIYKLNPTDDDDMDDIEIREID